MARLERVPKFKKNIRQWVRDILTYVPRIYIHIKCYILGTATLLRGIAETTATTRYPFSFQKIHPATEPEDFSLAQFFNHAV